MQRKLTMRNKKNISLKKKKFKRECLVVSCSMSCSLSVMKFLLQKQKKNTTFNGSQMTIFQMSNVVVKHSGMLITESICFPLFLDFLEQSLNLSPIGSTDLLNIATVTAII